MRLASLSLVLTAALLSACESREPPPPMEPVEGREETRSIRNTEAIGYSGDAIADKVDEALDANDQRQQQLDAELDEQTR